MISEDRVQYKVNFWLIWTITNALALGIGLPLGETVGRGYIASHGLLTGQIIGSLTCEAFIWAARVWILSRFHMQSMFRRLDAFLWPINELWWLATDVILTASQAVQHVPDERTVFGVTGAVLFSSSTGATLWLVFSLMRIPRRDTRFRFAKMFLLALGGFVFGSFAVAGLMALGLGVGEEVLRQFGYQLGLVAAGLATGGLIGAATGFVWIGWLQPVTAQEPA